MMREVAAVAAGKIVDDPHRKAALEQQIDHVAADKAGAAGDNCDRFSISGRFQTS